MCFFIFKRLSFISVYVLCYCLINFYSVVTFLNMLNILSDCSIVSEDANPTSLFILLSIDTLLIAHFSVSCIFKNCKCLSSVVCLSVGV